MKYERIDSVSEHANVDLSPESVQKDLALFAQNRKSVSSNWGATPLNQYFDEAINEQQMNIKHILEIRTASVPSELESIPVDIRSFATSSFIARFTNRGMANFDNFGKRLVRENDGLLPEQERLIERAIVGDASPAELIYVRKLLGIGSVELGCLTHPYGNNIDALDDMRASTIHAALLHGGRLLDEDDVYKVKQTDNLYFTHMTRTMREAFLMTRKRDIAVLPDDSVVRERSSFVIRIDKDSGFDQKLADNIRKVVIHNNPFWTDHITKAGKLDTVVPPMLERNEFTKAIPLSTTIYNFDRTTMQKIDIRDMTDHLMHHDIPFMSRAE